MYHFYHLSYFIIELVKFEVNNEFFSLCYQLINQINAFPRPHLFDFFN